MDNMAKKMLIDATHAEETRVVVVDGNKVEEFDFESENKRQIAGNIYLAKVTRVEPSLQAAFVDYGGNRHGFLAFSEIHPDYYQIPVADREALMEEERALAEADARAEEEDEAPKKRRRRGPRRRNNKPAEAVTETEVDGMETIDLDVSDESDENDAPMAAPIVEDEPMIVTQEVDDAPEVAADIDTTEADAPVSEPRSEARSEDAQEYAPEEAPAAEASDDSEETSEEAPAASDDEPAAIAESNDEAEAADDSEEPADLESAEDDQDDGIESVSDDDDAMDLRPQRRSRPRRYKIQEVIKVRQIMLVQVVKEERGNKGAALTTYLSLAGRYCVLMPNTARGGGISRKITNAADRKKLKEIATEIDVPTGAGLIIRTAGAKRTKTEIKRDYEYLQRLWEQIRELTLKSIAPAKIYEEGDLIKRSIRDLYNRDIDEVLVEGERGYRNAKDFMKMIMPSHAKNVKHYTDALPLFARYQVESYLSSMFNPVVQLKSGGYLVIGVTEALVAVDVNSGRATKEGSIEETALKTNLEAAEEVARQMRLRDLAGLIVIDFIDMDERRNNNAVEKRLKDKLKTDRARIQVGRISGFGLLEMSRQRLRPGMIEATTQPCPSCHGTGLIRSDDNLALSILRQIEEEGVRRRSREVLVKCPVGISNFIMNQKRDHVAQIEARYGLSVRVEGDPMLVSPDFSIEKFKTATRYVPEAAEPVVSADTIVMDEIDEDIAEEDDIETPESEQDEERKPKRRRRRRRRRKGQGSDQAEESEDQTFGEAVADEEAAIDVDAGDSAEEDSPVDEALKEEKPKRARRSRKKKGETVEEQPSEEAQSAEPSADEGAAEEEAPKPKRRTRRKKADEVKEETAETETPSEAEAVPVPEEEKPKRKRAPRKTKVQKEVEAAEKAEAAATEASAEPAQAAEEAPVAETRPKPKADAPMAKKAEEMPQEPTKPKRRGWWSLKR
jgi:ribonuclease E